MPLISLPRRPLESYPSRVLARWIRRREFSYFPEELDAIEREVIAEDIEYGRLIRAPQATLDLAAEALRKEGGPS